MSKLAGLFDDEHYLHDVEINQISLTRLCTKGLNFFLLMIQERTIWLSDFLKKTFVSVSIDLEMKLYSLV